MMADSKPLALLIKRGSIPPVSDIAVSDKIKYSNEPAARVYKELEK
jgi:hypothetical protein